MIEKRYTSKLRILYVVIALFLVLSLSVGITYAVVSSDIASVGNFEFSGNTIYINDVLQQNKNIEYDMLSESETHTGEVANGRSGTYKLCKFQNGGTDVGTTSFAISGDANAYIMLEIQFRYNVSSVESSSVYATDVNSWNIFPVFNSEFIAENVLDPVTSQTSTSYLWLQSSESKMGANTNDWTYADSTYASLSIAAPTVSCVSGLSENYYAKTYRMFVKDSSGLFMQNIELSNEEDNVKQIQFNLSDVLSEVRLGLTYDVGSAMPTMTGGTYSISLTCKATIEPIYE